MSNLTDAALSIAICGNSSAVPQNPNLSSKCWSNSVTPISWLQLREKPACHNMRNCLWGKYSLWSLAKNWRLLTGQWFFLSSSRPDFCRFQQISFLGQGKKKILNSTCPMDKRGSGFTFLNLKSCCPWM